MIISTVSYMEHQMGGVRLKTLFNSQSMQVFFYIETNPPTWQTKQIKTNINSYLKLFQKR